mmetsp:Transcript_10588/g.22992  ORF Transcript_10588/g.22992 Transcript_10588/m.22992 type:complete len:499 (-) Transcript_10588:3-1499(-)
MAKQAGRARKQKRDDNPLSSARLSGDKCKASSLWFRKSGAGYHLFLSFFAEQPGAVCNEGDPQQVGNDGDVASVARKGKGMSRAAKRRRKHKDPCNVDVGRSAHEDGQGAPDMTELDQSHPLVQAFESKANEWTRLRGFVEALSRPLPLTIRLRDVDATERMNELKQKLGDFSQLIGPVQYDKSIYQSRPGCSLCKSSLGKISPGLKEVIVSGSMDGLLARQELASMLPVLALSHVGALKAGAKVLDLCSSPGSKTLQALEVVCSSNRRGKVIANDINASRLESLREAVIRSGVDEELTDRVTFTNFDASEFPSPKSGKLFDCIICDVPCSGDGTIRKDKHILPMWTPATSNSLHPLQLDILRRALELVRVGGSVSYSTCSLNPIEDESVVSAALANDDRYELLDWPSDLLPGFVTRRGISDWKVAFYNKDSFEGDDSDDFGQLSFYDSHIKAMENGETGSYETLWPTGKVPLKRCMRLWPQDQDTGGFFVAIIRRKR